MRIGNAKSLKLAKFDKTKPLKILVHGFIGHCAGENFPGSIITGILQYIFNF